MHIEKEAKTNRIVLYGGAFNPVGNHHVQIARAAVVQFGRVVIVPCGDYGYKSTIKNTSIRHRKKVVELGFAGLAGADFDFHDFDHQLFSPTFKLNERYDSLHPESQICHIVGGDLIQGGAQGVSEIQRRWFRGLEVWQELMFVVINEPTCPIDPKDLPPHHMLLEVGRLYGRSKFIRQRVAVGLPIDDMVTPELAAYIHENGLYKDEPLPGRTA